MSVIKEQLGQTWRSALLDEENYWPDKTIGTLNDTSEKLVKESQNRLADRYQNVDEIGVNTF